MAVAIVAELVDTGATPKPVRVTVSGLTPGESVTVEGSCAGGSWLVPGGVLVASSSEVSLIDNRAALNVDVVYRVLAAGVVVASSASLRVTSPGPVLQSIDGQTVVPFAWRSNGLPMEPDVRVHASPVEGRQRPPVRYAPAGDGGGSLVIRTDQAGSAGLRQILRTTGGLAVIRSDGPARDWPPVELIAITSAPSVLWEAVEDGRMSSQRVHTLGYALADDPEPSRPVTISDWTDFQEAMVRLGWDYAQLEDFYAGLPDWASAAQVVWDDL